MREYFKFTFNDKELQDDFLRTFNNIGKTVMSNITDNGNVFEVIYINAKSVVNEEGAYNTVLKEIENIGSNTSKALESYDPFHFYSSIKTIVDNSNGSFLKLFNELKKFIATWNYEMKKYNVVWYSYYKPLAR